MIRTAAFLLSLPTLGFAHPHIFVDTDMILRVDEEGALYEVELAFAYDEFFSLLIIEDMGVDPDGDGILTEAEKRKLFGFDVANWPDGFEGDFYVGLNGEHVEMQRQPVAVGRATGHIVRGVRLSQPLSPPYTGIGGCEGRA